MDLINIYKDALEKSPDKKAIAIGENYCTYKELDININKYARTLLFLGIKPGDRVGLLMPNSLEIIYLYFACFKIGAIAVPSSYYSKTPEIIYEANHCGSKIYIVHNDLSHLLIGVKEKVDSLQDIYIIGSDGKNGFKSFDKCIVEYGNVGEIPDFSAGEDYPSAIFYTSGSTGKPKGVTHTHGSFFSAAKNRCVTLQHCEEDKFLTTSYLCHGAAPTIVLFPMLFCGGTAFFMEHYSATHFLKLIISNKVNFIAAGPSQYREIIESGEMEKVDFSFLKYVTSGGSAIPIQLQEDFKKISGIHLTASMGMTECGGYITTTPYEKRVVGSLGKPIYNTEVRIVNAQDEDVPVGEIGEIIVKSNSIMMEYWNDPQTTKKTFRKGWFCTGDLGWKNDEGYIFFAGRSKETIIVGSGNVTPGEVEDVLNNHPAIKQSIVVGVPDEITDQAVFAYIQFNESVEKPSIDELEKYAGYYLSDRKIPKYWEIINKLEGEGIMNKIDRKQLTQNAATIVKNRSVKK